MVFTTSINKQSIPMTLIKSSHNNNKDASLVSRLYFTRSTPLRMFGFSFLYLAQGVPIGLISIALPAWFAAHGVDVAQIATLAAITGLPWGFKLIAGPFMDRFSFPPMGRRRPWVMAAQAGLTMSMLSLALVSDPAEQFWSVIVIGFVINSFAAVQDVAVDGMAIDVLPERERGRANAFMAFGQVMGFSAFGALNGYLLVRYGLPMAAIVSTFAVAAVFGFIALTRERPGEKLLPWTPGEATPNEHATGRSFSKIFKDLIRVLLLPMSIILITVEFLGRASAGIAISIYPVLAVQELGYSSEDYAYWMGIMGGLSAVIGLFFGPLIDRFGSPRLLMIGLICGAISVAGFAMAESYWASTSVVLTGLIFIQLSSQLVFVAAIATFMGICWSKVSATQFAVYMSLANLSRSIGAGLFAGIAAEVTSAQALYIMAILLICAAVLLSFFNPAKHKMALDKLA